MGQGRQVFAISPAYWRRRRIAMQPPDFARFTTFRMQPPLTRKEHPMSHSSKTLIHVEETLNAVIESLIDGQEGFQKIGEELKDPSLKHRFLQESLTRASFRGDLEEVLHQEGVHDIKEKGSVSGTLHRTWGEFKHKLGGGDHGLLETAENGEDAAKKAYADALNTELPLPIREMLATQSAHIQASHDFVKAARDSSK
jgi:uncharacterized protein (TIGR02284 family)